MLRGYGEATRVASAIDIGVPGPSSSAAVGRLPVIGGPGSSSACGGQVPIPWAVEVFLDRAPSFSPDEGDGHESDGRKKGKEPENKEFHESSGSSLVKKDGSALNKGKQQDDLERNDDSEDGSEDDVSVTPPDSLLSSDWG
ncbi:hypothetical protein GUJ93_ZPchr0001g31533 [Zizania palustris]|uniref:Uncharacterized protein n=1 Tax=Zizania palustris TaxID=103762 RepID=A0A8J5V6H8_ZIZPA|nr:hypothetical protein GUJ93_ZPchr0001g31533 [Zizania palustris]